MLSGVTRVCPPLYLDKATGNRTQLRREHTGETHAYTRQSGTTALPDHAGTVTVPTALISQIGLENTFHKLPHWSQHESAPFQLPQTLLSCKWCDDESYWYDGGWLLAIILSMHNGGLLRHITAVTLWHNATQFSLILLSLKFVHWNVDLNIQTVKCRAFTAVDLIQSWLFSRLFD